MAKKQMSKPKAASPRPVNFVPPANVPTFYVNSVNIEGTSHDIRFRMGEIQSADDTAVTVAETVRVYMSHSHARALAAILNGVIARIDAGTAKPSDKTH